MSNGLCPNCEEEAFIVETQTDYLPDHLSDQFVRLAEEQCEARRLREAMEKGEGK
jgi:hypothetical protein